MEKVPKSEDFEDKVVDIDDVLEKDIEEQIEEHVAFPYENMKLQLTSPECRICLLSME
ncbi:MAG: hypothetical protein WBX01_09460 [Nitrososphaeraceae archaeon]|jgi:hypothetical protein